jgi:hypothetical protein
MIDNMIAEICSICQDNNDPDSVKKTPCGHRFHIQCMRSLIRPKCPLCNKNIMNFLVKNRSLPEGEARNEILRRIIEDDHRIMHHGFVRERALDQMDHDDLMTTAILAKKKQGDAWKDIYMDLLRGIINYHGKEFYQLSRHMNQRKQCGFLLLHCDLSVLINNLIEGCLSELIQWRRFNRVYEIDCVSGHVKDMDINLQHKVINGTYYFVIALQDDLGDNVTYFEEIELKPSINDSEIEPEIDQVIGYQTVMEKICDTDYHDAVVPVVPVVPENQWTDKIKLWAIEKIQNFGTSQGIFEYEKKYKFLSDVLSDSAESLFGPMTMNCSITILTPHDDRFHYILFKKNNKYIYLLKNGKIIGNNVNVSMYVHRRIKHRQHDKNFALILRFRDRPLINSFCQEIDKIYQFKCSYELINSFCQEIDKIYQFKCSYDENSITLRKIKSEIAKDCMNTDSVSGKRITGLSCEQFM